MWACIHTQTCICESLLQHILEKGKINRYPKGIDLGNIFKIFYGKK